MVSIALRIISTDFPTSSPSFTEPNCRCAANAVATCASNSWDPPTISKDYSAITISKMGPEIRIHPAPNELPNKHGLGLLMSEARPRLKTIRSEPLLFSIAASNLVRKKISLKCSCTNKVRRNARDAHRAQHLCSFLAPQSRQLDYRHLTNRISRRRTISRSQKSR